MSGKTPEHLVHGIDGPVVILSSRVSAYLNRYAGLDEYRMKHRGEDPEVDNALLAMAAVAAAWRSSATGTTQAAKPEPATSLEWLSTTQAGSLLGVTDRAVRKAIDEGRLKALRKNDRWRISRTDLEHYRAARAA